MPPRDEVIARLRAAGCVFAEDEADLLMKAATSPGRLREMIQRRADGEPLEYVTGWTEFCGLRVEVDPQVFVPRPRTEFLVECATRLTQAGDVVVDLCCGTGAIGAAVHASTHGLTLYAADLDMAAVRCARRNLRGIAAEVLHGDLYAALPSALRGRVNMLVANVPYVPTGELEMLPREARLYEPRPALDGGADGLEVVRRVAADASAWLAPAGRVLVETSAAQGETAAGVFASHQLLPRIFHSEELEVTVVAAQRS